MNLKLAILEDQKQDYEQIAAYLYHWAQLQGHVIQIYDFHTATDILFSKEILNCHILFSDIELKSGSQIADSQDLTNGITVCMALRNRGYSGEIIFLTAFREYVFNGYDVQALNYVLKPIKETTLFKCMDKYISLHFSDYYYYHKDNRIEQIPYNNIISISRDGHDCIMQTIDNLHIERTSLQALETRLPTQFLRCHKSCIINIFHIKALSGSTLKLSNNQTQPIGRIYLENIRKSLMKLVNDNF